MVRATFTGKQLGSGQAESQSSKNKKRPDRTNWPALVIF